MTALLYASISAFALLLASSNVRMVLSLITGPSTIPSPPWIALRDATDTRSVTITLTDWYG